MDSVKETLTGPIFKNNPIALQILGICSALAVTSSLQVTLVMCVALTLVTAFSNLSISAILGGHCLIGFIYPGETSTTTSTRQLILSATQPANDDDKEAVETFSQMTLQAVRDEDYALVATIKDALHSGANDSFLIGRNEPALQHYHRAVASITAAGGTEQAQ